LSALGDKTVAVAPCSVLNDATNLQAIYDDWYEAFWRDEQMGERLDNDLQLIRELGGLGRQSRVLDMACAYGRLSNALASEGHRVTGVDTSRALLSSARRQASALGATVEYLDVDLREIALPAVYDCVLLWATSFGHLAEPGDLAVLERALASLRPGGRLLIETRHWDSMCRAFEPITVRRSGPNVLIEHHSYRPETGVQWTRQTLLIEGRELVREYGVRRYTFPEMRSLCSRTGFTEVRGFDESRRPLQAHSCRCVLVATK
jgi:SAM-dependent methyltransferase